MNIAIRTAIAIGLTLWTSAATVSCGRTEYQAQPTPKSDGQRSYEDFARSVATYPYSAPRARQDRIIAAYPRLAVGATKEQVAVLLAEPDYAQRHERADAAMARLVVDLLL